MAEQNRLPFGKGTLKWQRDATANDSAKSFAVPAGKVWKLLSIFAQLSTSATVGNRQLIGYLTDGTNNIWMTGSTGNIAASSTGGLRLNCGFAASYTTGFRRLDSINANVTTAASDMLPDECYLSAGYTVEVLDSAAIDANADDLIVILHYIEYDA